MKRTAALFTAALALVATASPAQAAPETDPRLDVGDRATVSRQGTLVTWPVSFACPRGERYTVDGFISEYDSDAPWDDGGDFGVDAGRLGDVDAKGECTGGWQTRRLRLPVQPHDGVLWPLSPSTSISSQAVLRAGDLLLLDCGGPACADAGGTRVTVVAR
ncbi:hypothetical protein [Kineococcus sp. SYSU DK003]|uniref:hypothetical protein n=1 Tax=Kineococcus sp. SYSU DK003 TaxID=3383124 RepID=UPI003D7EF97A